MDAIDSGRNGMRQSIRNAMEYVNRFGTHWNASIDSGRIGMRPSMEGPAPSGPGPLLRTYLRLPKASRGLAWEALWELLTVELMVRMKPFKQYAPRLGKQGLESPLESGDSEQVTTAKEVRWAVRAVARRLPWTCRCLVQAIAGKRMLQRRGVVSTLYLGVDHGETKWLEAHAWLRCGEILVTGGANHERFRVISTFTEDTL